MEPLVILFFVQKWWINTYNATAVQSRLNPHIIRERRPADQEGVLARSSIRFPRIAQVSWQNQWRNARFGQAHSSQIRSL